jgi:hypothetical protein
MLIHEVTVQKPSKPKTPAEQRVTALRSQLDQARTAVKRSKINQQQQRLNQQRVALNNPSAQ